MADILFEPLQFRNLTIKNRILRSNISGRFDNYDGSGNQARINWELKFARGGVGAIVSSFVPVSIRGRILRTTRHRSRRSYPFLAGVGAAGSGARLPFHHATESWWTAARYRRDRIRERSEFDGQARSAEWLRMRTHERATDSGRDCSVRGGSTSGTAGGSGWRRVACRERISIHTIS